MNYGYPATVSSGYSKSTPVYSAYKAPYGFGKFAKYPFGKTTKYPYTKFPYVKAGKAPYGKIGKFPGYGYGFPATKSTGFSSYVPVTRVATSPFPGVI